MGSPRYERIIFTGQSGVRSNESKAETFYTSFLPKVYNFFKVEHLIKKNYATKLNVKELDSLWLGKFLQEPPDVIQGEWDSAIKQIISNTEIKNNKPYVVTMHAVYYNNRTKEFTAPTKESLLKKLKPQVFITLIDDVFDIHERLRDKGHIFNLANGGSDNASETVFELIRILDWRAREIMITRHLANELGSDHYVIATKHSNTLLKNLILTNLTTCYLSHPITQVRNLQSNRNFKKAKQIIEEIHQFEEIITNKQTAFLPTTIDEFRFKKNNEQILPEFLNRWDKEKYENPIDLLYTKPKKVKIKNPLWRKRNSSDKSLSALLEFLSKIIENQIDVRDHYLVEQSDSLCVYRPCYEGYASEGVLEELDYFVKLGKKTKCLIYIPNDDVDDFKCLQFEFFIRDQIDQGIIKAKKKMIEKIKLNAEQRNKLLDAYGDKNLFDEFLCGFIEDFQLNLIKKKGPLKGDASLQRQRTREKIIEKYFDQVDTVLNKYKNGATILISEIMDPKAILNKFLSPK